MNKLPFSLIRLPRVHDGSTLSAQQCQAEYCITCTPQGYPKDARRREIEGSVILDARIGRSGEIHSLSVPGGDPILAESALTAVGHWIFRPVTINGLAVEVGTQIEIIFSLPDAS